MKLNLLFKLSYLNSNFALTPGYLNPALNNPFVRSTEHEKYIPLYGIQNKKRKETERKHQQRVIWIPFRVGVF